MDPQALANAAELARQFRFCRAIPKAVLDGGDRSFAFAWKALSKRDEAALSKQGWRNIVNVDKTELRSEGSDFLGISLRGFTDRQAAMDHSRQAFERLGEAATGDRVYIFGTGPSLGTLGEYDFGDGKAIAINSMVKNLELLDRLDLLAITAADPIFHAGCSTYASEFRRHLLAALDRYRCFLLVPLRDFDVYRSFLPEEHHERLIGVPFDADKPYNIDLRRDYYVSPKPNVLTLLLFPLAATFYKRILVAGCDGRPLSESQYFWGHDPKSQFNDELAAIKRVHPGFFDLDYNDYYEDRVKTVEAAVAQFEAAGGTIDSLTPSFIPAFGTHYLGLKQPRIVSIDPDAVSSFGHYAGYQRLLENAAKKHRLSYELFGPCQADSVIKESLASFDPVFSGRSWMLRCTPASPSPERVQAFCDELRAAMADLRKRWSGDVVLFMYCGSLMAAKAAAEVLQKDDRAVACIVMFYLSRIDFAAPEYRKRWMSEVDRLVAERRVTLLAPTSELADEFFAVFGHRLPVLPYPSTTFADDDPIFEDRGAPRRDHHRRTIVFPSNSGDGKGGGLVVECLRELCGSPRDGLTIRVRYPRREAEDFAMGPFLESIADRVELIRGELTAADFRQLIVDADVAVLPYEVGEFRNRTSGLLVDALYCGVPSVVLSGTWLGNVVEKYGCGVAVVSADGVGLAEGIDTILSRYDEFRDKALTAREQLRETQSWGRLVDVVVAAANVSQLKRVPAPRLSLADRLVARLSLVGGKLIRMAIGLRRRRIAASSLALVVVLLVGSVWTAVSRPTPEGLLVLLAANLLLTTMAIALISVMVMRRFDRMKHEAEAQTRDVVKRQLSLMEKRLLREIKKIHRSAEVEKWRARLHEEHSKPQ